MKTHGFRCVAVGWLTAAVLVAACSSKTKKRGGTGGSSASGGSGASAGAGGSGGGTGGGTAGAAGSSVDGGAGDGGKTLAELCAECVTTHCAQESANCTAECTSRRNCIVSECAFEVDVAACATNACSTTAGSQGEYAALESCVCNSPCKASCDAHMKAAPAFIVCAP